MPREKKSNTQNTQNESDFLVKGLLRIIKYSTHNCSTARSTDRSCFLEREVRISETHTHISVHIEGGKDPRETVFYGYVNPELNGQIVTFKQSKKTGKILILTPLGERLLPGESYHQELIPENLDLIPCETTYTVIYP